MTDPRIKLILPGRTIHRTRRQVLRDSGFASVRIDGPRRIYAVDPGPMREVDAWLEPFRSFWGPRFEALATEVARGKRSRRSD